MKKLVVVLPIFLVGIMAAVTQAQQQFTQTVTKENKACNNGCSVIDKPELNGNTAAIIFVTPDENTRKLNPHPIGAYYMYLKKWSVFNLDNTPIPKGAKFNVQYCTSPDASRFVCVVPKGYDACIDNASLNNNPNNVVRAFPTGP